MIRKYLLNFRYAARWHKPRLLLRLVKTFLGILVLGRRPLRYVDFAIGYACNLKCEHCFATALEDNKRPKLRPPEYRKVVEQAMKLGAVNFSFQGGEPTIYASLLDFIRNSYPDRNLISVTTHGANLNKEKIIELRQAGVDILTISLDSAKAEEHDRFRGVAGTFDKTMNTIRLARENGLNVTLGAVVSHQNIRTEGFEDLVKLAHKLDVIMFVALASPVGRWEDNEDILLTEEDQRYLAEMIRRYPMLRTDFQANFVHNGCGAVKEILYLTPYGDVLPCPFLHIALGNIMTDSMESIRAKALENPYFKGYHHLCLAAEDRQFMTENRGAFYTPEGRPKTLC